MAAVQAPIIPILGEWIRQSPGTISLGQGMVGYGPPPEALAAVPRFLAEPGAHRYGPVEGLPALVEARRRQAHRREPSRPVALARGRHRRRQPRVHERGAGRGRSRRRGHPAGAVLLQPRDGRRDGGLPAGGGAHRRAVSTAGRRDCRGHHAAHARHRDDLAEQPERGRLSRGRPARGQRVCAPRAACGTSTTRSTSTSPTGCRTSRRRRSPGADAHTISLYSLSKAYGFASWRIGYMTMPETLWVAVNKIQDTLLICPPHVSQAAALGALAAGRAYCDGHVARPGPRAPARAGAARGHRRHRGSAIGRRRALLPAPRGTTLDSMTLAQRLIREHQVATVPGSAFGLAEGDVSAHVVWRAGAETVDEGMERLVRGIKRIVTPRDAGCACPVRQLVALTRTQGGG